MYNEDEETYGIRFIQKYTRDNQNDHRLFL